MEFCYDGLGRRDSLRFPGGAVTSYSYDADGRLTRVRTMQGGQERQDAEYTVYDDAGRLKKLVEQGVHIGAGSWVHEWTHNRRGQVRLYSGPSYATTYGYDGSGSRVYAQGTVADLDGDSTVYYLLEDSTDTPGVSNRVARLRSYASSTGQLRNWRDYTYDWNGNLEKTERNSGDGPELPSYWDTMGRLFGHYAHTDSIQFRYDGLRRLIMRRDDPDRLRIETSYQGTNATDHSGREILHGPGVDDPLVIFGSTTCYFVTHGGRLLGFLTGGGGYCGPGGSANEWTDYGWFAGRSRTATASGSAAPRTPLPGTHTSATASTTRRPGASLRRTRLA